MPAALADADAACALARYGIVAFAAVAFHAERGPSVEHVYPPAALSAEEGADVSFTAFHDASTSLCSTAGVSDTAFFIRVRRRGVRTGIPAGGAAGPRPGGPALRQRTSSRRTPPLDAAHVPSFLCGYVFCRERREAALPRGCERRALVVLATWPLACVLAPLSHVLGPAFFDLGPSTLASAAAVIAAWPAPSPRAQLALPLGRTATLHVCLPHSASQDEDCELLLPPQPEHAARVQCATGGELHRMSAGCASTPPWTSATVQSLPLLACLAHVDSYQPLKGVLMHAWTLWELLVIGAPLLVVAATPASAAATVTAIIALAPQLADARDWRPYFTVHDTSFPALAGAAMIARAEHATDAEQPSPPSTLPVLPTLLGVTNRLFLSALPHWPHILVVGPPPGCHSGGIDAPLAAPLPGEVLLTVNGRGSMPCATTTSTGPPDLPPGSDRRRTTSASALPGDRHSRGALLDSAAELNSHGEHLWSPLAPTLAPDTVLLNRLDRVELATQATLRHTSARFSDVDDVPSGIEAEEAAAANSAALSGAFEDLTAAFLAPFAPFYTPQPPPSMHEGAAALHRAGSGPPLKSFDASAFLAALAQPGAPLFERALLLRRCGGSFSTLRALYARFLAGAPFRCWFAARRRAAERAQALAWSAARAAADVSSLAAALTEVELVDAFGALEAALAESLDATHVAHVMTAAAAAINAGPPGAKLSFGAGGNSDCKPGVQQPLLPLESAETAKLRADLRALYDTMPQDMRAMLASHPQRAAMLGLPACSEAAASSGAWECDSCVKGGVREGHACAEGSQPRGRLGGLLTGALAAARGRLSTPPLPPGGDGGAPGSGDALRVV